MRFIPQPYLGTRAGRVFQDVGEGLLHDPVGAQFHAGSHGARGALDGQGDRDPAGADAFGHLVEAGQARHRAGRGTVVGGAQHHEHAA